MRNRTARPSAAAEWGRSSHDAVLAQLRAQIAGVRQGDVRHVAPAMPAAGDPPLDADVAHHLCELHGGC